MFRADDASSITPTVLAEGPFEEILVAAVGALVRLVSWQDPNATETATASVSSLVVMEGRILIGRVMSPNFEADPRRGRGRRARRLRTSRRGRSPSLGRRRARPGRT